MESSLNGFEMGGLWHELVVHSVVERSPFSKISYWTVHHSPTSTLIVKKIYTGNWRFAVIFAHNHLFLILGHNRKPKEFFFPFQTAGCFVLVVEHFKVINPVNPLYFSLSYNNLAISMKCKTLAHGPIKESRIQQ